MRRRSRAIVFSLVILTAFCPPSLARQDGPLPDLWLMRARQLADDLVKDADALGPRERALLWARLGEAWWQEDAERARAWMQKAVEAVESVPQREGAAERGKRLGLARELLGIVAPKGTALRARLLAVFTPDKEHRTPPRVTSTPTRSCRLRSPSSNKTRRWRLSWGGSGANRLSS